MLGPYRLLVIALLAVSITPSAAFARPRGPAPTRAQIRAAVRGAERSRFLWATVNICNTARHRDVIGIRAQMPALGFSAQLRMHFGVDYFSSESATFKPYPGADDLVELGAFTQGDYQSGTSFRFPSHAGLLRGRVTFEWRLGAQTIARTDRVTALGHPQAMYGDPQRFSSEKCLIP
jgi:hypothetical protein